MTFKKVSYLTAILFIFSNSAFAEEKCGTAVGNTIMGKVVLTCQNITGSANLTQTTMTGPLTVVGDLNATKSTLNSLNITGNVILNSVTVTGATNITGKLDATSTTFAGDMELDTLSANFDSSTTKNIVVTSSRQNQASFIYLHDNSVVNGDITFTNGNGIVQNHHSKITGKIIGGKLAD